MKYTIENYSFNRTERKFVFHLSTFHTESCLLAEQRQNLLKMDDNTGASSQQLDIVQALENAHATALANMGQQNVGGEDITGQDQSESLPEWAVEMRIPGVVYSICKEKAIELGWKLSTSAAGEGNDRFVCVIPAMGGEHTRLTLADLGTGGRIRERIIG